MICILLVSCSEGDGGDAVSFALTDDGKADAKNQELALEPVDYSKWVLDKSNGLLKEKEMNDFTFALQCEPVDYIICREEKQEKLKCETVNHRRQELEGMVFFKFVIALEKNLGELMKYQIKNYEEYDERVKYFSFKAQEDMYLLSGEDTIRCDLFHFERTFDLDSRCVFSLGFERGKIDHSVPLTFIYDDKIFKRGFIKLTFPPYTISNIPKLVCS
jgi:hypothetical protein